MTDTLSCAAVITAAGLSTRMRSDTKKELQLVQGVPVIRLVADTFAACGLFSQLIVTFPTGYRDATARVLDGVESDLIMVPGGETRQDSVYSALKALEAYNPDIVLIHDGARPWVSQELIRRVYRGVTAHGACIPVTPLTDAPKRIDSSGLIVEHVQKESLAGAQTPQGFRFPEILKALGVANGAGNVYSDDAEAYHRAIGPVLAIEGDPENRKITYSWDLDWRPEYPTI